MMKDVCFLQNRTIFAQGAFLDGQTFNENGLVLPEGYTITKDAHADGRPIYTVNYSK